MLEHKGGREGASVIWRFWRAGQSVNQSINLLKSLLWIEVAHGIRAKGSCIKRMTKIKIREPVVEAVI